MRSTNNWCNYVAEINFDTTAARLLRYDDVENKRMAEASELALIIIAEADRRRVAIYWGTKELSANAENYPGRRDAKWIVKKLED